MVRDIPRILAALGGLAVLALLLLPHPSTAAPAALAGPAVRRLDGALTATPPPTATIPPSCALTWRMVSSPNGSGDNFLNAVAVDGPTTLWAVGSAGNLTLIERWDGSAWSLVASPSPGTSNVLSGVVVAAPNDAWAVGQQQISGTTQTLILHWDGTAWSVVASPTPGSSSTLQGVVLISSTDIWAVGNYRSGSTTQTLTVHWDGTTWSTVPSPNSGPGNSAFSGVTVRSPNDVWAVGAVDPPNGGATTSLIAHWDGVQWSLVPGLGLGTLTSTAAGPGEVWAVGYTGSAGSYHTLTGRYTLYCVSSPTPTGSPTRTPTRTPTPTPPCADWLLETSPTRPPDPNILKAVTARTTTDLWAVGYTNPSANAQQSLTLHNDGTGWVIVPSPNGPSGSTRLYGVAAVAADNVWAVGVTGNATFILHWEGTQWTQVPSPNPGQGANYLYAVTARTATDLWAVGSTCPTPTCGFGAPSQVLILHGDGTTWQVVPLAGPGPGGNFNDLTAVTALAANDAWAVGAS